MCSLGRDGTVPIIGQLTLMGGLIQDESRALLENVDHFYEAYPGNLRMI